VEACPAIISRHPEAAASSAALEGRRAPLAPLGRQPGRSSFEARCAAGLAPQDDGLGADRGSSRPRPNPALTFAQIATT